MGEGESSWHSPPELLSRSVATPVATVMVNAARDRPSSQECGRYYGLIASGLTFLT